MPATKAEAATAAANELVHIMASMRQLRESAKTYLDKHASQNYPATWAAMATAPVNPDGSIQATAGKTSDPITVGSINRSQAQLVSAVQVLTDYLAFCQSGPVPTAQRSQVIDDLAG